ncbi:uncharacterized protein LOC111324979 [Stylophora pistillata]|uniref:uncharacterized protein LOC111324979 n=1 Tax=Stylophora pistillata TaxID=50429 RepID=UPI000C04AAE0|nr:uncharacterized protein LOC111324979 [Stylophora pistillata]
MDASTAARSGHCETNGNSTKMVANGSIPQKVSLKFGAQTQKSSRILSLLKFLWFVVVCLLSYVLLFAFALPLTPLIVVYYSLKLVERYLVYWTSGDLPLSGLDALWQQKSDVNRLAITGFVCAENKTDFETAVREFQQVVVDRMMKAKKSDGTLRYPRARCRIRPGYFQYFFQEDRCFRIENHVFKWDGEVPSSKEELEAVVSKLSNEPFKEGISPWYFCCVPTNFGDKDFTLVFKMSHSVADGVSLTRFIINQLPDQSKDEKETKKFTSSTSQVPLMAKAILRTGYSLLRLILAIPDRSILHGPKISGVKKVAWNEEFEFKLIKQIKTATGTTVNDVLMSCLSHAIRRYFQKKGVANPPDFKAAIPVDVRLSATKKEPSFENMFSLIFLKLAVGTEGVLDQLQETKARMDECKYSGEPLATACVMMLSNELLPEFVIRKINTVITEKASCVLSNVPGPQNSLSITGRTIKYTTFWPPQKDNIGVGLSIYTYAGRVIIGVQGDVSVLPDPQIITEEFGNALKEMARSVLHDDVVNGNVIH